MKKIYKYICFHCGKNRQSINPNKFCCSKCQSWCKPGKGQKKLF